MRLTFTPKADAKERANGRSLDPTGVMMRADGRLFQLVDDPLGNGTTYHVSDVTDLFDVGVIQQWQVLLTWEELNSLRATFSGADDPVYRGIEGALFRARLVE